MWGDCWISGSAETGVLVFKPLAVSYPESQYLWLEVDLRRLCLSKETVGPVQEQVGVMVFSKGRLGRS